MVGKSTILHVIRLAGSNAMMATYASPSASKPRLRDTEGTNLQSLFGAGPSGLFTIGEDILARSGAAWGRLGCLHEADALPLPGRCIGVGCLFWRC